MFKGLKSLIAGVAAGTALGMLFAPKKGEETRKNIKKEVDSGGTGLSAVKETLVSMGKDIGDACKEAYDEVNDRDDVKKAKATAKKKVKSAANKAKTTAKKKVKKAVDSAKKTVKKSVKKAKKSTKKKK